MDRSLRIRSIRRRAYRAATMGKRLRLRNDREESNTGASIEIEIDFVSDRCEIAEQQLWWVSS